MMSKFLTKHFNLVSSLICVLAICGISEITLAQTWEEQPGEIEEAEVVIEKNIKIELPFAARNFEKIPPQPIAIKPGPLTYSFISTLPQIKPVTPRLRAVTVGDEEIEKLYGGYLKAGFGNFSTPLVDAYLFSKRNEKYSLGAYGNYLASFRGPVDKENSASSDLNLGLTGSAYGTDASFSTDLEYTRLGRYFYGYPEGLVVDRDTIQQIINKFKVGLKLKGKLATTPWGYWMGAAYRITADNYEASEGALELMGGLDYRLGDGSRIFLEAEYDHLNRNDDSIDGLKRYLLKINPGYKFVYNRIHFKAALNLLLENDTLKGLDKFHVYPDIEASYDLTDNLNLFVEMDGGINKRSLDYWLQENPFLNQNVPVFHSNRNLEIAGGLSGRLISSLGFHLGVSVASVKNMSYLVNDSLEISKFSLAYDSLKTSVTKIFGELSLQMEKSKVWLRGEYSGYNTGAIEEPWHLPKFELIIGSNFNIYDKILIAGSFNSSFGIKSYDPVNQSTINLDPVLVLNLQVDYLLSKMAGIFVQANNVLARENIAYYRYPSRGFQIIAGVNLTF